MSMTMLCAVRQQATQALTESSFVAILAMSKQFLQMAVREGEQPPPSLQQNSLFSQALEASRALAYFADLGTLRHEIADLTPQRPQFESIDGVLGALRAYLNKFCDNGTATSYFNREGSMFVINEQAQTTGDGRYAGLLLTPVFRTNASEPLMFRVQDCEVVPARGEFPTVAAEFRTSTADDLFSQLAEQLRVTRNITMLGVVFRCSLARPLQNIDDALLDEASYVHPLYASNFVESLESIERRRDQSQPAHLLREWLAGLVADDVALGSGEVQRQYAVAVLRRGLAQTPRAEIVIAVPDTESVRTYVTTSRGNGQFTTKISGFTVPNEALLDDMLPPQAFGGDARVTRLLIGGEDQIELDFADSRRPRQITASLAIEGPAHYERFSFLLHARALVLPTTTSTPIEPRRESPATDFQTSRPPASFVDITDSPPPERIVAHDNTSNVVVPVAVVTSTAPVTRDGNDDRLVTGVADDNDDIELAKELSLTSNAAERHFARAEAMLSNLEQQIEACALTSDTLIATVINIINEASADGVRQFTVRYEFDDVPLKGATSSTSAFFVSNASEPIADIELKRLARVAFERLIRPRTTADKAAEVTIVLQLTRRAEARFFSTQLINSPDYIALFAIDGTRELLVDIDTHNGLQFLAPEFPINTSGRPFTPVGLIQPPSTAEFLLGGVAYGTLRQYEEQARFSNYTLSDRVGIARTRLDPDVDEEERLFRAVVAAEEQLLANGVTTFAGSYDSVMWFKGVMARLRQNPLLVRMLLDLQVDARGLYFVRKPRLRRRLDKTLNLVRLTVDARRGDKDAYAVALRRAAVQLRKAEIDSTPLYPATFSTYFAQTYLSGVDRYTVRLASPVAAVTFYQSVSIKAVDIVAGTRRLEWFATTPQPNVTREPTVSERQERHHIVRITPAPKGAVLSDWLPDLSPWFPMGALDRKTLGVQPFFIELVRIAPDEREIALLRTVSAVTYADLASNQALLENKIGSLRLPVENLTSDRVLSNTGATYVMLHFVAGAGFIEIDSIAVQMDDQARKAVAQPVAQLKTMLLDAAPEVKRRTGVLVKRNGQGLHIDDDSDDEEVQVVTPKAATPPRAPAPTSVPDPVVKRVAEIKNEVTASAAQPPAKRRVALVDVVPAATKPAPPPPVVSPPMALDTTPTEVPVVDLEPEKEVDPKPPSRKRKASGETTALKVLQTDNHPVDEPVLVEISEHGRVKLTRHANYTTRTDKNFANALLTPALHPGFPFSGSIVPGNYIDKFLGLIATRFPLLVPRRFQALTEKADARSDVEGGADDDDDGGSDSKGKEKRRRRKPKPKKGGGDAAVDDSVNDDDELASDDDDDSLPSDDEQEIDIDDYEDVDDDSGAPKAPTEFAASTFIHCGYECSSVLHAMVISASLQRGVAPPAATLSELELLEALAWAMTQPVVASAPTPPESLISDALLQQCCQNEALYRTMLTLKRAIRARSNQVVFRLADYETVGIVETEAVDRRLLLYKQLFTLQTNVNINAPLLLHGAEAVPNKTVRLRLSDSLNPVTLNYAIAFVNERSPAGEFWTRSPLLVLVRKLLTETTVTEAAAPVDLTEPESTTDVVATTTAPADAKKAKVTKRKPKKIYTISSESEHARLELSARGAICIDFETVQSGSGRRVVMMIGGLFDDAARERHSYRVLGVAFSGDPFGPLLARVINTAEHLLRNTEFSSSGRHNTRPSEVVFRETPGDPALLQRMLEQHGYERRTVLDDGGVGEWVLPAAEAHDKVRVYARDTYSAHVNKWLDQRVMSEQDWQTKPRYTTIINADGLVLSVAGATPVDENDDGEVTFVPVKTWLPAPLPFLVYKGRRKIDVARYDKLLIDGVRQFTTFFTVNCYAASRDGNTTTRRLIYQTPLAADWVQLNGEVVLLPHDNSFNSFTRQSAEYLTETQSATESDYQQEQRRKIKEFREKTRQKPNEAALPANVRTELEAYARQLERQSAQAKQVYNNAAGVAVRDDLARTVYIEDNKFVDWQLNEEVYERGVVRFVSSRVGAVDVGTVDTLLRRWNSPETLAKLESEIVVRPFEPGSYNADSALEKAARKYEDALWASFVSKYTAPQPYTTLDAMLVLENTGATLQFEIDEISFISNQSTRRRTVFRSALLPVSDLFDLAEQSPTTSLSTRLRASRRRNAAGEFEFAQPERAAENANEDVAFIINSMTLANTLTADQLAAARTTEVVYFGENSEASVGRFNAVPHLTLEFNGHLEEVDEQEPRVAIDAFFIAAQRTADRPVFSVSREARPGFTSGKSTTPKRKARSALNDDDDGVN